jgi:hypothetical protein
MKAVIATAIITSIKVNPRRAEAFVIAHPLPRAVAALSVVAYLSDFLRTTHREIGSPAPPGLR